MTNKQQLDRKAAFKKNQRHQKGLVAEEMEKVELIQPIEVEMIKEEMVE